MVGVLLLALLVVLILVRGWDHRVGLCPWGLGMCGGLCGVLVVCVTGWQWLCWLPIAPVDSVASLVTPLSGQNLVSVRDLYKREPTSECSFGFVFFQSGMSSHSYLTLLAVCIASCLPATSNSTAYGTPKL